MEKYHKIQTVFLRDPKTDYKTLLDDSFAKKEFEFLKNNIWIFTEKIDGTNIRVIWDGKGFPEIRGKSDRAQIPPHLLKHLRLLFCNEMGPVSLTEAFPFLEMPICLYGEGFGWKIQNGGKYQC